MAYPKSLDTPAKRALYDNLGQNEALAVAVDAAVRASRQDDWRSNAFKVKKVTLAIQRVFEDFQSQGAQEGSAGSGSQLKESPAPYLGASGKSADERLHAALELVKNQNEY